jgi:MATE family multidrug resistance protein
LIATVFRMMWLFWSLLFTTGVKEFESRRTWRWDSDKVRRFMRVGWPAGMWLILEIGAWATFQVAIIGMFGRDAMAATATVWRYTELSFMPAVGIGIAISTMVGRSIGENRKDLAYQRARMGAVLNTAYMGMLGACFVLFGRRLVEVFSHEPAVIVLGARMMIYAAIFQVFDAFTISYQNALRGAGDTRWPAIVGALQAWGIMIGGGWLVGWLRPDWGSYGPWTCATLYVVVVGTTLWLRWRAGEWEQFDVIGRHDPIVSELGVAPTGPGCGEAVATAETASRS